MHGSRNSAVVVDTHGQAGAENGRRSLMVVILVKAVMKFWCFSVSLLFCVSVFPCA